MIGAAQAAVLGAQGGEARAYATFDPDYVGSGITLSNGNLTASKDGASWTSAYFTCPKSSGKWAFELTIEQEMSAAGGSQRLAMLGMADTRNTGTFVGAFAQSKSMHPIVGQLFVNGTGYGGWYAASAAGTKFLFIIDADNDYSITRLASPGGLQATGLGAATTWYGGVALYDAQAGAFSVTLNAGQAAFSAENEALISAYESANGVTINRGLWL